MDSVIRMNSSWLLGVCLGLLWVGSGDRLLREFRAISERRSANGRTALENVPVAARGICSGILQQGYSFGYLLAAVINLGTSYIPMPR